MTQDRKKPYRYKPTKAEKLISLKLSNAGQMQLYKRGRELVVYHDTLRVSRMSPDEIELVRDFWNTTLDYMQAELKRRYGDDMPDKFRYRALPDGVEDNTQPVGEHD